MIHQPQMSSRNPFVHKLFWCIWVNKLQDGCSLSWIIFIQLLFSYQQPAWEIPTEEPGCLWETRCPHRLMVNLEFNIWCLLFTRRLSAASWHFAPTLFDTQFSEAVNNSRLFGGICCSAPHQRRANQWAWRNHNFTPVFSFTSTSRTRISDFQCGGDGLSRSVIPEQAGNQIFIMWPWEAETAFRGKSRFNS